MSFIGNYENSFEVWFHDQVINVEAFDKRLRENPESYNSLMIYSDLRHGSDHISMEFEKRKRTILSKPYRFIIDDEEPKEGDKALLKEIEDFMELKRFRTMCSALYNAVFDGTSILEFDFNEDRLWQAVEPYRIRRDVDRKWRLLTQDEPFYGVKMRDENLLQWCYNDDNYYPYGIGIGRRVYFLNYMKSWVSRYWMSGLTRENTSSIFIHTNSGSGSNRTNSKNLIQNIHRSPGGTVGQDDKITQLDVKTELTKQQLLALEYLDKKITIAILGAQLTTSIDDKGNGGLSASRTHEKVNENIVKSDAKELEEVINYQYLPRVVDYVAPGSGKNVKIRFIFEDEHLSDYEQRRKDGGANLIEKGGVERIGNDVDNGMEQQTDTPDTQ